MPWSCKWCLCSWYSLEPYIESTRRYRLLLLSQWSRGEKSHISLWSPSAPQSPQECCNTEGHVWHAPSAQDKSYIGLKANTPAKPHDASLAINSSSFPEGACHHQSEKSPIWEVAGSQQNSHYRLLFLSLIARVTSFPPGEEVILISSLQEIRGDASEDFVPFRGHKVLTVMAREAINKLSFRRWLWRMGKSSYFRGQWAWSHLWTKALWWAGVHHLALGPCQAEDTSSFLSFCSDIGDQHVCSGMVKS